MSAPAAYASPSARVGSGARRTTIATLRRVAPLVGAAALYLAFAAYVTWPVVTDPQRIFYGGAGDPMGSMAYYRELVEGSHNPFAPGRLPDFNAPAGQPVQWVYHVGTAPTMASLYVLTWAVGEIAAANLYTLAGFVLSGLALFALARRLGASGWAALLAGWAFAFYPFAVVKAHGHWEYVHGWVLVVALWRLIEMSERPTRRNGLLAGLAVCLAMWWTPYFVLLGGVAYAAVALASLALATARRQLRAQLAGQIVAAAVVAVFLGALGTLTLSAEGTMGLRTHGIEELNTYSARPLEYLVPPGINPWFGQWTGPFLQARIHGSNNAESTLYVGLSIIGLAAVGLLAGLRRRRLEPRLGGAVLLLFVMTLVAGLSSAPPEGTVAGVTVPFPSHFIFELTSTWRVYARFVVVVMLGLSLLAAIGLSYLARGRSGRIRVAILVIASLLVSLDLWTNRLGTNRDGSTPIHERLARLPGGRVAEYPLVPAGYNLYSDLWFQKYHEKPVINGYAAGSREEQRALSLSDLSDPATATRLAELGVRYVVLRPDDTGSGLAGPGTPTRDFRLIAKDFYGSLLQVDPRRSVTDAVPGVGFGAREIDAKGEFQWLMQPAGRLELLAACRPCRGQLTFRASSFGRPRVLFVSDERGVVIARRRIDELAQVRVDVRFDGRASYELTTSPGPQPIAETVGGGDVRAVSVQVRDVRFRPDRGRRSRARARASQSG